jgi:hypothetical protein
MCGWGIGGFWGFVCLRGELVYWDAFGPGPWRVGGCGSIPDEQTVWTVRIDETVGKEKDAGGAAVKIEKGIHSFI